MSFHKYLGLGLLAGLLMFGCSKKKEEAAQLEQELLSKDDTAAETVAVVTDMAAERPDIAVVSEEPEIVTPGAPVGEGYTVQVASCEDRAYAEYLVQTYTQRGYEPYMTTADVEGQTFYRVRIGSFATLAEARTLKNQLVDRYSIGAWIDYL